MKLFYTGFMKTSGLTKFSVAFAFIFLTAFSAYAVPANNNFLNAQLLSGVGGTFVGNNIDATKQVGEPYHFGNLGGRSIWYKFVAPGNGVLHFATSNSNIDTVVGVYTGTSVNDLTLVGENDNDELDGWMKLYSRVYIGAKAGQTYYIAVDGKNPLDGSGAAEGTIAGNFSFENKVLNDDFNSAITLATGTGTYSITTSNVGASKESGEPNYPTNPGGKSVWFNYYNASNSPRSVSLTLKSSLLNSSNTPVTSLITIYQGNTLATLVPVQRQSGYGQLKVTFLAAANFTYHITIDGYDGGTGAETGSFTITYGVTKDIRIADFNQDGKADFTVFRPTEGNWYSRDTGTNNMRAYHWGLNADVPLMSQDPSGESYHSVFRPDTGTWWINSANLIDHVTVQWGMSGDVAMYKNVATNSGISSFPTVFRPSNGTWWVFDRFGNHRILQWGQSGDIPVSADFDGDGNDEYVVFRPSNGTWYFYNEITNQFQTIVFGQSGDVPVPADYNADGIADIAVFRPSTGDWWFRNAQTGEQTGVHFGQWGDKPQPADYDGDGKADICIFRQGTWWIQKSSNGVVWVAQWGLSNDIPVTAPIQ